MMQGSKSPSAGNSIDTHGPGFSAPPFARHGSVVKDLLLGSILRGEIEAGQSLNQLDLAHHFHCSQNCVREALCELKAAGLLSAHFKRGFHVQVITPQERNDLLVVKSALEDEAVMLALERCPEVVNKLRPLLESAVRAASIGDNAAFRDADRAFCNVLIDGSKCRPLGRTWMPISLQFYLAEARNPMLSEITQRSSRLAEIVDTLACKHPQRAKDVRNKRSTQLH